MSITHKRLFLDTEMAFGAPHAEAAAHIHVLGHPRGRDDAGHEIVCGPGRHQLIIPGRLPTGQRSVTSCRKCVLTRHISGPGSLLAGSVVVSPPNPLLSHTPLATVRSVSIDAPQSVQLGFSLGPSTRSNSNTAHGSSDNAGSPQHIVLEKAVIQEQDIDGDDNDAAVSTDVSHTSTVASMDGKQVTGADATSAEQSKDAFVRQVDMFLIGPGDGTETERDSSTRSSSTDVTADEEASSARPSSHGCIQKS